MATKGEGNHTLEVLPISENLDTIRATWQQLTSQCPHSYFLSWAWMESWLQSQQDTSRIRCVFGYRANTLWFGFFIGLKDYRKHGLFPTKSAHLNATGHTDHDTITIEYNDILCPTEDSPSLAWLLFSQPLRSCNEIVIPGASAKFANAIRNASRSFYYTENRVPSYHTDLSLIRERQGDYLSLLSSNKRQQIRRSIREYEKRGPLQHRYAESSQDALTMFREMGKLHSEVWEKRRKSGSFSNKYWVRFHETLIGNHFDAGGIHISKIFTDATTLGYVYGFIHNDTFLFCQCGFNYENNNKLRPGIVSHYLLIRHFAERGLARYDFLAGESDYKRSLATHSTSLYWLALQRRIPRFAAARVLKAAAKTAVPSPWIKLGGTRPRKTGSS